MRAALTLANLHICNSLSELLLCHTVIHTKINYAGLFYLFFTLHALDTKKMITIAIGMKIAICGLKYYDSDKQYHLAF